MFDWLRRNQESRSEHEVVQERDLGDALPTLESCPMGQTPLERGAGGTAGWVGTDAAVAGATAVSAHALDGEVDGSGAGAGVAEGSGEVCEPAGPIDPLQDVTPQDVMPPQDGESSGLIGSEAAAPPLSGRGAARRRGRRLLKPEEVERAPLTGAQRLWILDTWKRSGLPAGDFAPLVGVSKHTLYSWKKQFAAHGPAGLMERKRGVREGSRLPELTKRTILLLKEAHPEWGYERISAMLLRGPALPASASAVARVLHEAGYQLEEVATHPHADKVRHFERAKPNQLWQTDLFTFVLKRQNRRVYLVALLDDHSRFIVSYGLHASPSTALVLEVLRAAIASHGVPQEILTDNGAQYVTWRGTSQFTKELQKQGIRQIVAAPRRPQTLGKIERWPVCSRPANRARKARREASIARSPNSSASWPPANVNACGSRRSCVRQQALMRASERVVGLASPQPPKATLKNGAKATRRRRPTARALYSTRAAGATESSRVGSPSASPCRGTRRLGA